jgi:hypothetical protein
MSSDKITIDITDAMLSRGKLGRSLRKMEMDSWFGAYLCLLIDMESTLYVGKLYRFIQLMGIVKNLDTLTKLKTARPDIDFTDTETMFRGHASKTYARHRLEDSLCGEYLALLLTGLTLSW